jgi:glycosyltransferase involved in cell wall biosynthesis
MRVAYLTSRYPAVSHTFVLREVEALRREGVEVHTFSVRRADEREVLSAADRREFETTTAILPVSPLRVLRAHGRALAASPAAYLRTLWRAVRLSPGGLRGLVWQLFYFAEALLLQAELAAAGVRHVHVHFANVSADVAMLATGFGRLADGDPRWGWSFTMHGPTEFYDVAAHRLPAKAADARLVVCISDFARSQLMGMLPEAQWGKLRIVHCGVDPSQFAPAARQDGGEPLAVLCVGRLVPVKGQAVLLDAVGRLAERGVPVHATFVGDGPSRPDLERIARERGLPVTFAGAVGQDEIRRHYGAADVFCLPSFAEGVPVVLMEAMAMTLPVVTTRIAGIPELVADEVGGLLVAPGDAGALADALARLAGDPALRRALGDAGRAAVEAGYDIGRIGPQLRAELAAYVV